MASRKNSIVIIHHLQISRGISLALLHTHTHTTSPWYYTRLIAVGFPESVGEPLKTLVETVTGGGAGGLNELGIVSNKFGMVFGIDLDRGHTQARRVKLWRPSCCVISAGLMAF